MIGERDLLGGGVERRTITENGVGVVQASIGKVRQGLDGEDRVPGLAERKWNYKRERASLASSHCLIQSIHQFNKSCFWPYVDLNTFNFWIHQHIFFSLFHSINIFPNHGTVVSPCALLILCTTNNYHPFRRLNLGRNHDSGQEPRCIPPPSRPPSRTPNTIFCRSTIYESRSAHVCTSFLNLRLIFTCMHYSTQVRSCDVTYFKLTIP